MNQINGDIDLHEYSKREIKERKIPYVSMVGIKSKFGDNISRNYDNAISAYEF